MVSLDLTDGRGRWMYSAGLPLFRRQNGVMRNFSIKYHHPNCTYLEVESVGARESSLWKQALCQTERERTRAWCSQAPARNVEGEMRGVSESRGGKNGKNVLPDWATALGQSAPEPCSVFYGSHAGEKLTDMCGDDKSPEGASTVCSSRGAHPQGMLFFQTFTFSNIYGNVGMASLFLCGMFSEVTQNI